MTLEHEFFPVYKLFNVATVSKVDYVLLTLDNVPDFKEIVMVQVTLGGRTVLGRRPALTQFTPFTL